MQNFVIVGAGPVGLWTAIQIRKRCPNSTITLYERYEAYRRQHVLKIQHSSVFFGASRSHDELDDAFFEEVFLTTRKNVKRSPFQKSFISTNTIESNLKKWAIALGCEIVYKHIDSLEQLLERHNSDAVFILANGAHSELRRELLGVNDVEKTDLQHILELKTRVSKGFRDLKSTQANGAIKGKLTNLGFEYIGRTQGGETPLSFRLFVNEALYNETPDASFKAPIKDPTLLPESVKSDIDKYASLHGLSLEEVFAQGQVSKLQLSVYHAKKFAAKYENRNFFLVGDAAMGVPYFRALNSGLVLGSRLALMLSKKSDGGKAVNLYNSYQHVHQNAEELLARTKNTTLNTYNELRKLYRMVKTQKDLT